MSTTTEQQTAAALGAAWDRLESARESAAEDINTEWDDLRHEMPVEAGGLLGELADEEREAEQARRDKAVKDAEQAHEAAVTAHIAAVTDRLTDDEGFEWEARFTKPFISYLNDLTFDSDLDRDADALTTYVEDQVRDWVRDLNDTVDTLIKEAADEQGLINYCHEFADDFDIESASCALRDWLEDRRDEVVDIALSDEPTISCDTMPDFEQGIIDALENNQIDKADDDAK